MTAFALETYYKGHRFRSRLEARWAVFFDTAELEWLYEPQGYKLSDGTCYLPDFFLPEWDVWVEVKGNDAALNPDMLCRAAQELPGKGLLLLGNIPAPYPEDACGKLTGGYGWHLINKRPADDDVFPRVTVVDMDSKRREEGLWFCDGASVENLSATAQWRIEGYGGHPLFGRPVEKAFEAARCARFEHGESGYMPSPPKYGYLSILGDLCEHGCTYDTFCPVCDSEQEN